MTVRSTPAVFTTVFPIALVATWVLPDVVSVHRILVQALPSVFPVHVSLGVDYQIPPTLSPCLYRQVVHDQLCILIVIDGGWQGCKSLLVYMRYHHSV